MNAYSTKAKCINCGFGGMFGTRIVVEYGKSLPEVSCPACGTPNLQIHNGSMADTQVIRDGLIGTMEFVVRDKAGRFQSLVKVASEQEASRKLATEALQKELRDKLTE